jgi:pilus assembly protein Flp/PilA
MKKVLEKVVRFLVSDDGPTAVEYAVMLALIILVCFAAIQALGTASSSSFERVVKDGGFGG